MRNRNGVQSAKPVDQGDRGVIDQRDAIPQDIPLRCAKEQSALADREPGLRANSYEPRLVLAESVVVRNPEPLEHCPRLALGWNILTLVLADGALNRRSVTRRILCAAGTADECRHGLSRLTLRQPMRTGAWLVGLHRGAAAQRRADAHAPTVESAGIDMDGLLTLQSAGDVRCLLKEWHAAPAAGAPRLWFWCNN
jgi:hypothetical protein